MEILRDQIVLNRILGGIYSQTSFICAALNSSVYTVELLKGFLYFGTIIEALHMTLDYTKSNPFYPRPRSFTLDSLVARQWGLSRDSIKLKNR